MNSASADPGRAEPSAEVPAPDGGFSLVEMVIAVAILFGALVASGQIVIRMVTATVFTRHADFATTLGTQVIERAVANDCGGKLPDNRDSATDAFTRWSQLQTRCRYYEAGALPSSSEVYKTSHCRTGGTTPAAFPGWQNVTDASLYASEENLGRRFFIVNDGPIYYCVSYDVSWVRVGWTGSNGDSMRLRRQVQVQWIEPSQPTKIRERTYSQVAALPPDSVQSGNQGLVDIQVTGANSTASVRVAFDGGAALWATFSADRNGWVHLPYLPTDVTTGSGASVTVTPSFSVVTQTGSTANPNATISSLTPVLCITSGGIAPPPVSGVCS